MSTSRAAMRRWIHSRRAAELREREERAARLRSPAESLHHALGLIRLAASIHGWPLPRDPASARDDTQAYAQWARLRRRPPHP